MPDALLARLEAMDAGLTSAPWEVRGDGRQSFTDAGDGGKVVDCACQWADDGDEEGEERDFLRGVRDVVYLTLLRNSLPALIAYVRAADESALVKCPWDGNHPMEVTNCPRCNYACARAELARGIGEGE